MFKLIRKVLFAVVLLLLAAIAWYLLGNPTNRRVISQTAEEASEALSRNRKAPAWVGTVVVVDAVEGDRVIVNTETSKGVVVRLAGVDAPEMPDKFKKNGQPLAEESRALLSSLVKDKAAEMTILGTDAAKTPLVVLKVDGQAINLKMAEAGLAETTFEGLDTMPARLRHELENAEIAARAKRTNIWGLTNYVRPVEHRIRQQKAIGLATPR